MDLFKLPGVAETIDWANCLVALDRIALDPETVNNTLGVLLKYQDDIERIAGEEAARLVTEAKAAAARGLSGGQRDERRVLPAPSAGPRRGRTSASTRSDLVSLCEALLGERGEVSGAALAREALAA